MIRRSRVLNLPEAPARIVKVNGSSLGIITFDEDNGYPQRMITLKNACSTAKQCVDLLKDYTIGQGWEQEGFNNAVINEFGLTPDWLLDLLAEDKSLHKGYALHINYNALYQKAEFNYIPFENVRLGYGENEGKLCLCNDWYNTDRLGSWRTRDIHVMHRYNPDPEVIQAEVDEAGGWENYNGQVLWYSEAYRSYPLSTIDPVLESVVSEIESDKTTTNNLKNNFQLKYLWALKGKTEDPEEREEEVRQVQQFMGSEGKPVVVIESTAADGSDIPTLTKIESAVNDKLFAYTDEKVRAKIYRAFRQPAILHSDYMGSNGYNKDQLLHSMEYYTNYTHPIRIHFETLFEKLFDNFHENINPANNYSITPLALIKSAENQNDGNTTTNI